jgi:cytidine deaminase
MSLPELRFRASHLDAVRNGTKRITMRFNDPVEVGLAMLVFDLDDEVRIPGRIVSTVAKRADSVTDDEGEPLYVLADPAGHPFCLLVGHP